MSDKVVSAIVDNHTQNPSLVDIKSASSEVVAHFGKLVVLASKAVDFDVSEETLGTDLAGATD